MEDDDFMDYVEELYTLFVSFFAVCLFIVSSLLHYIYILCAKFLLANVTLKLSIKSVNKISRVPF